VGDKEKGKNCSLLILHLSLKKRGESNDKSKSKMNNEQFSTCLPSLSPCLLVPGPPVSPSPFPRLLSLTVLSLADIFPL
jgi:hypothetical protein